MNFRSLAAVLLVTCGGTAAAADVWNKPAAAGAADLLPAESAFQLVSVQRAGDHLTLDWIIAPGYYLYRKRLGFEAVAPAATKFGKVQLPAGKTVHDEHFGTVEIYRETLHAQLPLQPATAPLQQLRVHFQGCADAGVCYPPITRVLAIEPAAP